QEHRDREALMRMLAFDTATSATTVALAGAGDAVLEARHDPEPGGRPGHATHLLPLAAGLLDRAGIGWDTIERLAVGVGPGTFTGLRIGIATARAVGDGALPVRSALEHCGAFVPEDGSELHRVRAAVHCLIAERLPPAEADHVRPEYLRPPDARPSFDWRAALKQ